MPAASGRILIVDDDERQRSSLAAMLADCDFETQVAADGQEALERLSAFDYTLQLPPGNQIRSDERPWGSVHDGPDRLERP